MTLSPSSTPPAQPTCPKSPIAELAPSWNPAPIRAIELVPVTVTNLPSLPPGPSRTPLCARQSMVERSPIAAYRPSLNLERARIFTPRPKNTLLPNRNRPRTSWQYFARESARIPPRGNAGSITSDRPEATSTDRTRFSTLVRMLKTSPHGCTLSYPFPRAL